MLERKGLLSSAGRGVIAAVIAGLVITMAEPPMAAASPTSPVAKGVSAAAPSGGATDISARRRHYHRGGNAAGLAIMGMMIGTVGPRSPPSNDATRITITTAMGRAITGRRPSIMDGRSTATVPIMAAAFIATILTKM